jgi:hypothetical protein
MTPTATLDAPDTEQQPATQLDYGVNNRNLPDCLKRAITTVFKEAQNQEKYIRRQEILQDAEHRFYDMGIQHIYRNADFCWTQAFPGVAIPGSKGENFGNYIDDYNIFTEFALIQRAKLSENVPGIDFQPVDPNESDDIEAANTAEGYRHDFDRNNDIKQIEQSIYYHLQMGGRAVMWTRSEDYPEKFGDQGRQRRTTATVYGCVEAKVPIFANTQKDFWYTILYDDPDIKMAKTKYDWIADKLTAGQVCLDENAYERVARLQILQGTQGNRGGYFNIGDSIAHLISRGNGFFRLAAFEAMDEPFVDPDGGEEMTADQDGNERPISIKEKLAQLYPDGVHACVVGDQYAESWNKSMDDCLSVGNAYIGKGQSRMPVMKSMVVVQDRFNSTMNFIAECFDYGAPSIWMNCSAAEFAAFRKQHASPYAFRNLKSLPPGVTSLANAIYREQQPEVSESQQKYMEFLYGALPQFQLAVPPSIWGEAMKDQKTAAGFQLAASQAMGILGVYYAIGTTMTAAMYYHSCLAIMEDDEYPQSLTIPGEGGKNTIVNKAALSKGNFRAFPDTESGFPESTSAKRTTLTNVVTQIAATPLAAQVLGSPDNVALMVREYGLPELVIPEAEARNKQLREIETLLKEPPKLAPQFLLMLALGAGVQDIIDAIKQTVQQAEQMQEQAMVAHAAQSMAAKASGQPEPPAPAPFDPTTLARSSVRVWDSDYHVWESKKCRDWLSSDDRNTEETIGREGPDGEVKPNISGILNVVLHKLEHDAKAALEAPPVSGPLPAPNVKPLPGGVTPAVPAPPAGM